MLLLLQLVLLMQLLLLLLLLLVVFLGEHGSRRRIIRELQKQLLVPDHRALQLLHCFQRIRWLNVVHKRTIFVREYAYAS